MKLIRLSGLALVAALTLLPGAAGAAGTERVSLSTSAIQGNSGSEVPAISADGRFVAFESTASNLDPDDGDVVRDVFLRDRQSNTTTLISRASGVSGAKGNAVSYAPSISADGRFVAFYSLANNLHPDDSDGFYDVFVRDRQTATTILVSRATGSSGAKGNNHSQAPAISADGRFIAFMSNAANLHPDDADTNVDIFVRDLQTDTTTLDSRRTGSPGTKGNLSSYNPSISADGHFVAFFSNANNLDSADLDFTPDVFRRDRQTNLTTLVSRANGAGGAKGNSDSLDPSISADGRFVAFYSYASTLDPDDGDGIADIFVRDVQNSTTALVSRGSNGVKGNDTSTKPAMGADGRFVAFHSLATNLHFDDVDSFSDVYVRDLQTGVTILGSRSGTGFKGNLISVGRSITGDGSIAFYSSASNLVSGDTNGVFDAFVNDDLDQDGMPNSFEVAHSCLNVEGYDSYGDPDFDSLASMAESSIGTDPCNADSDHDGSLDSRDGCALLPEDYDGFQDSDGCPDPDNDVDGICDAGQTSVSCSGSDAGKYCFDAAGNLACHLAAPSDCRNVAEDLDAFKDTDGCPEPDNDNDGFPDATDQCPGTGSQAGADGMLGSPQDANHNGISDGGEPPLTTDDVPTYAFEDRDGVLDTDGCHDSPGEDFDGDGFTDDVEAQKIGTNPGYPCGNPGWPADLLADNRLNVGDINSFLFPLRGNGSFNKFDHPVPDPNDASIARWNLQVDGTINIGDLNALNPAVLAPTARPPMFGGQPAFFANAGNGVGGCPLPP